jgi:aminoglycoside phosphotransferase (APT) family kinase protein
MASRSALEQGAMDDTARLDDFLRTSGLAEASETARWTPLAGGVSSDIWRVDLPGRSLCVKRALPRLKVAAEWHAPTSRNAYEWAWIRFAARHVPLHVPLPLAHDAEAGLFAMSFLDPERHPVWKRQLLHGRVDIHTAHAVGIVLARIHAASAGDPAVAHAFPTLENFRALRLEPYLIATGRRHPDLAARLSILAERTGDASIALVHGDVSPKNILVGPNGPVLLDAECAWYGDPAFDIAFCLNHLLLKCLLHRELRESYLQSFEALRASYCGTVDWEDAAGLEARAAALLPGLLLARVDGKSPVEYLLGRDADQAVVRDTARALLLRPRSRLGEVADAWRSALAA